MNRLLCCAFILTFSSFAFANSSNVYSVSGSFDIGPNTGIGDGWFFTLSGPHVFLNGYGGTACSWCYLGDAFDPGQTLGPENVGLFAEGIFSGHVGNVQLDQFGDNIVLYQGASLLYSKSIMFPLSGQDFSVTVPVKSFFIGGEVYLNGNWQDFTLRVRPGKLVINFQYGGECPDGTYCLSNASFQGNSATTPEPSAFVLVGSGILALMRIRVKRSKTR